MYSVRLLPSLAYLIHFCTVSEATVTTTDDSFKQTVTSSRMPETTRKEMQHDVLGHHETHNPTEINVMETAAAQFMLALYKMRIGEKYEKLLLEPTQPYLAMNDGHFSEMHEIHGADLIMCFLNDAPKLVFLGRDRDHVVYFDMSTVSSDHILSKAELRLYKEKRTKKKQSTYRIETFRLRRGNGTEDESVKPETNVTVSGDYEGWISINVTDAAHYWNVNRKENFGLDVRVTDVDTGQKIDPKKCGIRIHGGPKSTQPFMMTVCVKKQDDEYVWRTRSERRGENFASSKQESAREILREIFCIVQILLARRSASQQGGNSDCQKHPLYINFTTLGWTHVIAPLGYNASYCAGECYYSPAADVTLHTTVQSLLNLDDPSKIPKPCCSPSKLSRYQVLYTDDNKKVILKHYEDMVVEDCGCF
ncbi:hypothetical protein ACJMK2_000252 [Sinanodonta woodiana]|uniref:TGF-beta family profile domain-containing protein n=1 Tax=Sinanodonta woodiana TaxID=1069815 RepID=A0ABD3XSA1_SINWO